MEKERKSKVLAIVAICISLVSLTIGFSAFAQNLTINGNAVVQNAKWSIKFDTDSLQGPTLTGQAAVGDTAPTLTATNFGDFDAILKVPGDSVSYTFDVVNDGTIDAQLQTIDIPTPTCTGNGANATNDAANVCKNLTYTLKYSDGTTPAVNNTLNATESKTLVLTLTYNASATSAELPKDDVTISNLSINMIYEQK